MFASMFWALCKLHHLEPFQSHIRAFMCFFFILPLISILQCGVTTAYGWLCVQGDIKQWVIQKKQVNKKKVSDYQPLRKSKHLIKQMLGNICKIRLKWAVLIWDKRAKRGWVIFIPQKASSHQAYLIRPCCFVLKAALLETVSNTSGVSSGKSAHICNC